MVKYAKTALNGINAETIENNYIYLLEKKYNFIVLEYNKDNYILTKEKSLIKVYNLDDFLKKANDDIYYNTSICDNNNYLKEDLDLYYTYLNNYKNEFKKKYGDKYLFGSVAVKTIDGNMITTIRGKKDLDDFTIVSKIDNNLIFVNDKKASLNAPLLYNILKIKGVKSVIHINHKYDERFVYLDYAFPGTVRDSNRVINKSFNIANHGMFILLDEDGKEIV